MIEKDKNIESSLNTEIKQKTSVKVKILLLVVLTFAFLGIFLILSMLSQGNFWGDLIK